MPSAPPLPPFEEGIRTWGELIGILDPMDEAEQIIDPLVVTNGVDRIRRMGEEERSQLAIQLVRFLAILYAEILRMLQMVDQDDVTVLLQVPDKFQKSRLPLGRVQVGRVSSADEGEEELSLMQAAVDKFGMMLQKLLSLLEKMGQPLASARASFLLSMLADVQRPGNRISAAVIERMDRLQALLLSFGEGVEQDITEEDRKWCFSQWGVVRPVLLDKKREGGANAQHDQQTSSSSGDIVCLEDSQESAAGCGSQVAVLSNGTTRPLTQEEVEEIAFHEQLEQAAAEQEAKADEQRWLEYWAQCLQEEEDQVMQEALAENEGPADNTQKKARVMVQVEGEGGRIVRSEIFNMVVKDGEALTYKIMVLPRDDPEVRRLRRQQAVREGETVLESDSEISGASAETVPVNQSGRVLPLPPVVSNEELDAFMKTVEGDEYYKQWLAGKKTCQMVRERSGCGLLAKFFQRKVEEEEEQRMLQAVLQAEEAIKPMAGAGLEEDKDVATGYQGEGHEVSEGAEGSMEAEEAAKPTAGAGLEEDRDVANGYQGEGREVSEGAEGSTEADGGKTSHPAALCTALSAPSAWPSFTLRERQDAINLDSQDSVPRADGQLTDDVPAAAFTNISPEENAAELAFAIAAGDVPAEPPVPPELHEGQEQSHAAAVALGAAPPTTMTAMGTSHGDDESATEQHTTSSSDGLVQTNLRNWLV